MDDDKRRMREEIENLEHEIDSFQQEKERVRKIVGKIGGMPNFNSVFYNVLFMVLIIACLVISLFSHGALSLAMVELAIAFLSVKILYLIHLQNRVHHMQLWIISSLEWQVNEIRRTLKPRESEKGSYEMAGRGSEALQE